MDAFPAGWALASALNHWLLYGATLLAVGAAIFCRWIPSAPPVKAFAAAQGRSAAMVAAICYVLAVGLIGADLLDTPGGVFGPRAWIFGSHTTLVSSAVLGVAAMVLLRLGFAGSGRRRQLFLVTGIALAAGSFLVTGHPVSTPPRIPIALGYALHLLGAAFWLGSLLPLRRALGVLPPRDAGMLLEVFSRRAVYAVGAIVVSGVAIAAVQLGSFSAIADSSYGLRLLAKLALVAIILALALTNKIVLTPALLRADPPAAARLRKVIALEFILMILVLGAVVALTLVAPPREVAAAL